MKYEIWLGGHFSHFEKGLLHMEDGQTMPLKGWIHSATYGPDTILIADEALCTYSIFPVRWYIEEKRLAFYCWDEDIASIVLHNESGKELEISGFSVLKAGETRELLQSEW